MSRDDEPRREEQAGAEFARQGRLKRASTLGELFRLVGETKKWWMLPLILVLLGLGLVLVLSSTGVAPFIYTVF